ncbi:MAG: hypothetical protein ACLFM0_11465 [Spirochaetales bacterium]
MSARAYPLLLFLLLLSCNADAPAPSLLRLETQSEDHARMLLSSLTRAPIVAPDASVFPGIFEISEVDASTLTLIARDPVDDGPATRSGHAPPWHSADSLNGTYVPATRARRAEALSAMVQAMFASRERTGETQHQSCLQTAREHAYRLYFVDRAADERRGHAPSGAAGESIRVAGASLSIALVDESDPTLPATPKEIRRRLTHTAFSPCSLPETGPYRRVDSKSDPENEDPERSAEQSAPRDALTRLPEYVEISLEGDSFALLARADRYGNGSTVDLERVRETAERAPDASGTKYAAGTRYDLLVANTASSRLPDSQLRSRILERARRSAAGVPPESSEGDGESGEEVEEPIRFLELPGESGTVASSGAARRGIESLGVELAGAAEDRSDYRNVLLTGDYDLARIVWDSESAHDAEVFRMFRSIDPRNYAEFRNAGFDALAGRERDGVDSANGWRLLERHGAATLLGRDLHRVRWELFVDPRNETAESVRRTVESSLWQDAYGQLWFAP